MTATHEEHQENNMSEALRTVLISLATAGIIWLVYTAVDNKAKIQLQDYKLTQIQKTVESNQADIKEILKAIKK